MIWPRQMARTHGFDQLQPVLDASLRSSVYLYSAFKSTNCSHLEP